MQLTPIAGVVANTDTPLLSEGRPQRQRDL